MFVDCVVEILSYQVEFSLDRNVLFVILDAVVLFLSRIKPASLCRVFFRRIRVLVCGGQHESSA